MERELEGLPDAAQLLRETTEGARLKAKEMLKECSKVTIKFFRAASPIIDTVHPPKPKDIIIMRPQPSIPPTPASPPAKQQPAKVED
jgi:hypothetical protein